MSLRGPVAVELEAVDRELADLGRRTHRLLERRTVLLAQLRPGARPPATSIGPDAVPSPRSVQTTLLALGALLLSVAGVIFTVLAWGRLGIGGRASVLLGATLLAATVSASMLRRELRATADATAVLTLVLTALDLHALRLLTLPDASWAAWWAAAAAQLTAAALTTGTMLRLPALAGTAVTGAQTVLPLALVAALRSGTGLGVREVAVLVGVTLLGTACVDLVGVQLSNSGGRAPARELAAVLGVGQLAVAGLVATGAAFVAGGAAEALPASALLGLVALVAASVAAVRSSAVAAGGSALAALLALVAPLVPGLVRSDAGLPPVLLVPAVLGVALVALSRLLPHPLRLGPCLVGLAATGPALAADLGRIVAGLTAPLDLLAHPWAADAPATTQGVLAAVVPGGQVGLADLLALVLVAVALTLLPGPDAGHVAPVPARALARGLVVAATLLLPTGTDLPLPLAVAAALAVLAVGAAVLAMPGRATTGTTDTWPLLPMTATALAWSATDPLLTLLGVGVVATLAAVVAASRRDALALAAAAVATIAGLALVPLTALALGASGPAAGCALALASAVVLLVVDRPVSDDQPVSDDRRRTVLGSATVGGTAGVLLTGADPGLLSVLLCVLGIAALAAAARPHRRAAAALGALLLLAAGEIRLALATVDVPEAYLLPAALLALTVGEVVRHRRPELDPTVLLTPGLGLALAPSLLLSLSDDGPLRPLLLTVGAFAVVAAGAQYRLKAPLAAGAATLGVVALRQLAPLAAATPRWVVLAVVGLVLLVLGARYERTREDVDRLRRSFARLS